MRSIRFRAWHKKERKMLDVQDISFTKSGRCVGARCFHAEIHGGFWYYYIDEDIDLMQYTGLKDKNGKEIYEGDIVKTLYVFSSDIPHGQIKFKKGRFFVEWMNEDEEMNDILHIHAKASEIIGNIYENPELLE